MVPSIEKVILVVEVLVPDAPIYDGPQNGMYKLCVRWRLRYMARVSYSVFTESHLCVEFSKLIMC